MKKIEILGPGCAKCKQLTRVVEEAIRERGADHSVEKVTELDRILAYGVMTTPALVVDGQVRVMGRVPSRAEVKKLIE